MSRNSTRSSSKRCRLPGMQVGGTNPISHQLDQPNNPSMAYSNHLTNTVDKSKNLSMAYSNHLKNKLDKSNNPATAYSHPFKNKLDNSNNLSTAYSNLPSIPKWTFRTWQRRRR